MGNWLGLPILASEHGGQIDRILVLVHVLMIVLFVGWGVFFLYCLFRFRRKRNPQAAHDGLRSHASNYLEVAVVVIEAILLLGFSIPFWMAQVDAVPKPEDNPFIVRVVGQQFAWTMHYPGPDGEFGRTRIDLVDDVENPLGIDRSDPAAKDDIASRILRLPVGRQALIYVSSKDVIHSFSVPEFRVKQDAIPGQSVPVHFTPTMTSAELKEITGDKTRNFEIVCSQLCGLGHFRMMGLVFVEDEEKIQAWIENKAGT